jgi:hypothetical protein
MAAVLLETATALGGGWRSQLLRPSFGGGEYDELVDTSAAYPECTRLLDRATRWGELHGVREDAFPVDAALEAMSVLRGETPCGAGAIAINSVTQRWPVPATIDYAIVMQRAPGVVTYTVALPGTGYGSNIAMQLATDLNPLAAHFVLTLGGVSYTHSLWQGFYASVAGGVDPPVMQIVRKLADARRAAREQDPSADVEHRLVVAGYSIGAAQALLLTMLLCDDTMHATAASLGVTMAAFASRLVVLVALPNASRGSDTCAYVERMCALRDVRLYSLFEPMDALAHFYTALPLARPAVPYVHVMQESGVYRLNAASFPSGVLYAALARVPLGAPWRLAFGARLWWRAAVAALAAHMLEEYRRKLRHIQPGGIGPCGRHGVAA